MAADRRVRLDRLDGARRLRGHRPAQHQAADGLFLHRPHGLCAGRTCRRHRRRRAGRADLHGDLCCDDARRLRLHPGDAPRRRLVENISDLAGLSRTHPTMAFFLAMLLFSLAGIPPLAGFFAKFYVFLAAIKAGLYALAVIGVLTSVVGAYYYLAHRQDHVFRRAGEDSFQRMPGCCGWCSAVSGLVQYVVLRLSRAAVGGCDRGGEIVVLSGAPTGARLRIRSRVRSTCTAKPRAWRGSDTSLTTRSARPMPRRWRLRAPASAGRCGSRAQRQTPAAAGAATPGSLRPAISTSRCC